jgi:hypothetical protein
MMKKKSDQVGKAHPDVSVDLDPAQVPARPFRAAVECGRSVAPA